MAQPAPVLQAKLVLLGESCVGKSSLVGRFARNEFHEFQESTIGAAFVTGTVAVPEGQVRFEIWDTAGQERYHSLTPMYYRGAQAALVVFDVTRTESYERALGWVGELREQAFGGVVVALVANKVDLELSRAVSEATARQFAARCNLLYAETSAKTGQNVEELFRAVASALPRTAPVVPAGGPLRLPSASGTGRSGCCQ